MAVLPLPYCSLLPSSLASSQLCFECLRQAQDLSLQATQQAQEISAPIASLNLDFAAAGAQKVVLVILQEMLLVVPSWSLEQEQETSLSAVLWLAELVKVLFPVHSDRSLPPLPLLKHISRVLLVLLLVEALVSSWLLQRH